MTPPTALPTDISVCAFADADWRDVWGILEPVFRAGDTYSFASDIDEQEARRVWIDNPARTFVAADNTGQILGTYFIKANQPGQGGHVCNCGHIVAATARGKGIASAMCEHSQREAVRLGFRAMQYNLVVSTNTGALSLWRKLGFDIVGTLPKAFLHPTEGFVDAHILYKMLET
jgi:ribosomal protein S18 acetylase RimI-like enzyme